MLAKNEILNAKNADRLTAIGADFLCAYLECSDPIRGVIHDMLKIISDEQVDDDDRHMALVTLDEALFPNRYKGQLGMDLAESEKDAADFDPELKQIVESMDLEEANFSDNLRKIMLEKNISQTELAKRTGVSQSAIANMLARSCRPQKQTVMRLAEALDVESESLWPLL